MLLHSLVSLRNRILANDKKETRTNTNEKDREVHYFTFASFIWYYQILVSTISTFL